MTIKTKLRLALVRLTGYWIYKYHDLTPGCDLFLDLSDKLRLPMKVIFDVGANAGQTALRFNTYYPNAKIFCFEPVTDTFRLLEKRTEHLGTVQRHQLALGDASGPMEIQVFSGDDSVLNSLNPISMNQQGQKETIAVLTGDEFCGKQQIEEIDFLKIDTEGYELQVLKGFAGMVKNNRIKTLYCEVGFHPGNKRNTYINELMNFSSKNNFTFYGMYEVNNQQMRRKSNYGNVLMVSNNLINSL